MTFKSGRGGKREGAGRPRKKIEPRSDRTERFRNRITIEEKIELETYLAWMRKRKIPCKNCGSLNTWTWVSFNCKDCDSCDDLVETDAVTKLLGRQYDKV